MWGVLGGPRHPRRVEGVPRQERPCWLRGVPIQVCRRVPIQGVPIQVQYPCGVSESGLEGFDLLLRVMSCCSEFTGQTESLVQRKLQLHSSIVKKATCL